MTLLRWLTFLHGSLTVILTVLLFWIYLFLLTQVFVVQWLWHWEILIMLLSQFSLNFRQTQNGMPCWLAQLMTISELTGIVLVIIWEYFKLSASAAASEFCEWVQVGIDVHPHLKYQFQPPASPWFSAACAAAIVRRNHLFWLSQKNKSFDSKSKFRQAINCCKRVLGAAKLDTLPKKRVPHFPETWLLGLLTNCQ